MFIFSSNGCVPVLVARSFATHLAGSQNATRESLRPLVTSIRGYALASTLSYGEYARRQAQASASRGLPHCSHSCAVSGMDASSMVLMTSTKGTSATMVRRRSGRRLATTPITSPPALPPLAASRSREVYRCLLYTSDAADE